MGMTIDESIGWIEKNILDMRRAEICISDRLALETAIDSMRKYQKIQEILNNASYIENGTVYSYTYDEDSRIKHIREVIEDGKID